jgi:hypothetical protein
MNKRRLNTDDFAVETFEAGMNPMAMRPQPISGDGCTVWTTCSPTCDSTVYTTDTQ